MSDKKEAVTGGGAYQNIAQDNGGQTMPAATLEQARTLSAQEATKDRKAAQAFRTISEVADILAVPQHVLRFWETKFTQVKPLKRGGGRRYYRPEDIALLQRIHHLLYDEGYTIKGVQKLLKGQGKTAIIQNVRLDAPQGQSVAPKATAAATAAKTQTQSSSPKLSQNQKAILGIMLDELKAMRAMLHTS